MGCGTRYFAVPRGSLGSRALRVSGKALEDRQRAVHLLQLVESVEVNAVGPVVRSSSSWCMCLYVAVLILTLTSVTYVASAFGMLSTGLPLRSEPAASSHAAALNQFDNTMPTVHTGMAVGGGVRRGWALTQLYMLEPMTVATVCLTAASKISMPKTNSAFAQSEVDDDDMLLLHKLDPASFDSSKLRGAGKQRRREQRKEEMATGGGSGVSRSKSWEDMGTQTIVAVSAAAELAKRRVKRHTLHAVKTFQESDSQTLRNRASLRLGTINHELAKQLDDEMSPESMVIEDTMESVLDTVDAIYKQTTTLVSRNAHAASHTHHSLMSPSAHHTGDVGQAVSHLAPFLQHKGQILAGITSAMHAASALGIGGMASAGVAAGLATVAIHTSSKSQEQDQL
jgi:hypothetical protein